MFVLLEPYLISNTPGCNTANGLRVFNHLIPLVPHQFQVLCEFSLIFSILFVKNLQLLFKKIAQKEIVGLSREADEHCKKGEKRNVLEPRNVVA